MSPRGAVAASTAPPRTGLSEHEIALRVAELERLVGRLATRPSQCDGVERARAIAASAMNGYWTARHPGKKREITAPPAIGPAADDLERELGNTFGESAAKLPPRVARFLLSSLYAGLLPDPVRSEHGVYFTPPPLVDRLLDLLEECGADWRRGRVLDPAAGGGAFLAPVAERMEQALSGAGLNSAEIVDHVMRHLRGIELDPFSSWVAQVMVEDVMWLHCERAGRRLHGMVETSNSLEVEGAEWENRYDVVVGNPPYGRITLSPALRERFRRSIFGHANLYGVFTDLAVRFARPDGLIGYVTPTSFLGGLYFKNLRRVLTEEAPPVVMDFVTDRSNVFEGVLQETLLIVYRPGAVGEQIRLNEIHAPALFLRPTITTIGGYAAPDRSDRPWILPRSRRSARLLSVALSRATRLADYGLRVSTGPLVWNRHKTQLVDDPGAGALPLIWAEAVPSPGTFKFKALRRNHKPFFVPAPGQEHLIQHDECVLIQRTTAKEQQRRLVAALLPREFLDRFGGAVVENHLNMVRPVGDAAVVPLAAVAAVLNASVTDDLFRCVNGSVAVSAYELESLPFPDIEQMCELARLVENGASAEETEQFIYNAYTALR